MHLPKLFCDKPPVDPVVSEPCMLLTSTHNPSTLKANQTMKGSKKAHVTKSQSRKTLRYSSAPSYHSLTDQAFENVSIRVLIVPNEFLRRTTTMK